MADPLANLDQFKSGNINPTDSTNPLSNLGQYSTTTQDQVQSTPTDFGNEALKVGKDVGVGILKGGASLLDMFSNIFKREQTPRGTNLLPGEMPGIPVSKSDKSTTFSEQAKEALPEYNHPILGAGVEGAVGGATLGPMGAALGAAANAGTEALNEYNPGHPITNTLLPMGASMVATPFLMKAGTRAGKLASEGLGLTERPEFVQAKKDLGISAGTAASTATQDDPFWFKMQRSLRERLLQPKSSNIEKGIEEEQHQLNQAVNKQADTLFPAQTKQQLGTAAETGINSGVDTAKNIFRQQENRLDTLVNPKTTEVNMIPFVDRAIDSLASNRGSAIPLTGGATQSGDVLTTRLIDNVLDYAYNRNNLNITAIRDLKQQIGDKLQDSLLNGDISKRQLKIMYGILADAQEQAYANTPYLRQYQALKSAEAEMFDRIESFADPLIKAGVTPEKIADRFINESKLGGTKLNELFRVVPPEVKDQFGSSVLRSLGRDANGEFSPDRFFKNWQRIAPEARQALFGQGMYQDVPKIYDQLALIAQNQARGANAINKSGTAGTAHLYHELMQWGALAGGTAGLGLSVAEQASRQDQVADEGGTLAKGAMGAGLGAAIASLGGSIVLGRMLTNPAFVRWIATPVPVKDLPMHMRALSTIAAENPNIQNDIKSYQDYLQSKGMLGGGLAGWPEQTPTGYAYGGLTNVPKQQMHEIGTPNEYAGGGFNFQDEIDQSNKAGQEDQLSLLDILSAGTDISQEDQLLNNNPDTFSVYTNQDPFIYEGNVKGESNPPYIRQPLRNQEQRDKASVMRQLIQKGPKGSNNLDKYVPPSFALSPQELGYLGGGLTSSPFGIGPSTGGLMGYAQGGISYNTNDPRPFYNPQLPGVAAGFAGGGIANDNLPPSGGDIISQFIPTGGYSSSRNVVPLSSGPHTKYIMEHEATPSSNQGFMIKNNDPNNSTLWTTGGKYDLTPSGFANDNSQLPYSEGGPVSASQIGEYASGGLVDQASSYLADKLGISPEVAKGAVKYMFINESKLDPNIVNPTSGAYGIGQWLGPRKTGLFNMFGPKPNFQNQLDYIVYELNGPEKKVLMALKNAKNEKQGYDAWGAVFERPGSAALAKAGVNYKGGDLNDNIQTASYPSSQPSSILDHLIPTSDEELEENTGDPREALAQQKVAESPFAEPLTKSAIYEIWRNANV